MEKIRAEYFFLNKVIDINRNIFSNNIRKNTEILRIIKVALQLYKIKIPIRSKGLNEEIPDRINDIAE